MTIFSLLPLLAFAVSAHLAFTPTQPPALERERVEQNGTEKVFRYVARLAPFCLKSFVWLAVLAESFLILATTYPSTWFARLFFAWIGVDHLSINPLHLSGLFILGLMVAISGSLFRYAAVRHLGSLFTYELAIRQDHRLVTSGPYSIVRHPSYAGVLLFVFGGAVAGTNTRGGMIRDVVLPYLGWHEGPWTVQSKITAFIVFVTQLIILSGLVARVPKEDAMLREEFRDEWNEWARRVPYTLIPLIY